MASIAVCAGHVIQRGGEAPVEGAGDAGADGEAGGETEEGLHGLHGSGVGAGVGPRRAVGSGQVGLTGPDPALQLTMSALQLQVATGITVRQQPAKLASDLLGLSAELSDQGKDLILHCSEPARSRAGWRGVSALVSQSSPLHCPMTTPLLQLLTLHSA